MEKEKGEEKNLYSSKKFSFSPPNPLELSKKMYKRGKPSRRDVGVGEILIFLREIT